MTWSVCCPNSAIAAPLAGVAEAHGAPTSPEPAAISIARAALRILLSCVTSPPFGLASGPSVRMHLPRSTINASNSARSRQRGAAQARIAEHDSREHAVMAMIDFSLSDRNKRRVPRLVPGMPRGRGLGHVKRLGFWSSEPSPRHGGFTPESCRPRRRPW